ncbi:hypothetical protein [Cellulomonas sp. S1-8]|uniref:hypothetical protein n=1 Tax=Cellulomonas sp. S1-8 TaxID=2904790 RepID=UPI00224459D0|nr:hypothetical protein [Cellulomonas sp. S1-8]UZN03045.1 hypothetical protein OKX07_18645 [Cellulomonas sp. S1-8]
MNDRRVAALRWGLPTEWVGWVHGDAASAGVDVDGLREEPRIAAAVLAAVGEFESIASEDLPGTTFAALWVPGEGIRRPLATAALGVAAPPLTGRPDIEALLESARSEVTVPTWTKLLDVAALPSRVTAGEAILRIVDKAPRLTRRLYREWTWVILPPDTGRMVLCQVGSSSIAHFDQIADMTTDIANSVEVTLEPA